MGSLPDWPPTTPVISKFASRGLLRPPRRSRAEAAVHVPERIVRQRADGIADEQSGLCHAIAHALLCRGSDIVAAKCRSLRSGTYITFGRVETFGNQKPLSAARHEQVGQRFAEATDLLLSEVRLPALLDGGRGVAIIFARQQAERRQPNQLAAVRGRGGFHDYKRFYLPSDAGGLRSTRPSAAD